MIVAIAINIQVNDSFIDSNPSSKRKLNNNESDISNLQTKGTKLETELFVNNKQMRLIIDPVSLGFGKGLPNDHFVSRSNDCRKNIRINRIFKGDQARFNCEFVSVRVNGWPSIFLMTIKDVKKGNQLWSYYGSRYKNAMDDANSSMVKMLI